MSESTITPVQRTVDPTAADLGALEALGLVEETPDPPADFAPDDA